jgi:two-component system response regulator HydG
MEETVKVLVVDDDCRMVKTICDILKAKGFAAVPAFSGEEAVEIVRGERPDCVLMDVKMPGIDGVEALRMMKEMAPDLPVVLMSAYSTGDQAEEAKRRGAYSVLTKPIDIQQLLSFLFLLRKEQSILVVDDDPEFCRTLKDVLQSRNYQVETEDDPEKVLGRLELGYELAVVLDLKPGNADGLDVLRDIRRCYPAKPVILVTGYREEMADSIEKGLLIGAYTCLYKPLATEELIGIIEEISREKLRLFLDEPSQV